jgi:hypothetical protein
MEVAFVVYLARRSQLGGAALCCARWLCCAAIGGCFMHGALQRYLRATGVQTGGGSQRDGAQAALLLVLWAACTLEGEPCCIACAATAAAPAAQQAAAMRIPLRP